MKLTRLPLLLSIILAIVLVLTVKDISAQYDLTTLDSTEVIDTEPPRLFLVVIVDDSSTVTEPGLNSINTSGLGSVPKTVTDNTNERWKFVAKLASMLNADPTSIHELAVMSFDTDVNGWYTDTANTDDPFIPLGQASSEEDQARFNAFMTKIANPPKGDLPGNTSKALVEAQRVIDNWVLENSDHVSSKPVILLITDDVPLANFGDSPWAEVMLNWNTYQSGFMSSLTGILQSIDSSGNYCQHGNGEALFVTLAMGAANWVNAVDTEGFNNSRSNRINTSGEGQYFQAVARDLGSRRRTSTAPLVYPIDPLLESTIKTRDDFQATLIDLYDELRCTQTEQLPASPVNNQQQYVFEINPFNDNFLLLFDETSSASIRVFPPDTENPLPQDLTYATLPEGHAHQVWSISRSQVVAAGQNWEGTWTVSIGNGSENPLRNEYQTTSVFGIAR